ncbi:UAA transporter family-domain-containing protein [Pyronema omphalodes]|nr:UAA transporter family-domain-containing protein [Pyronema omphalodes]
MSSSLSSSSSSSSAEDSSRESKTQEIDARPHLEAAAAGVIKAPEVPPTIYGVLAQCTLPAWMSTVVMVWLIFGGCCSNVFALEAIIKQEPHAGHLITFAQFALVAFEGLIYHFDPRGPCFLKPRQIPLRRWAVQIALFWLVSIMNNQAFAYNISVPVHIILRSGGSMTTLLVGWCWGKRYSRVQVISVVILTVGCILSALADGEGMGKTEASMSRFITGLVILFVAQLLSAIMGLYIEATYTKYGNNYREGLFYTHALGLPLFLIFSSSIKEQYLKLSSTPPLSPLPFLPPLLNRLITALPHKILYLILNALTQYVCVRGVNILGSVSSALTVTIVLNIRKLVSLWLSIWLFGNNLSGGVMAGAGTVFVGGLVYGLESQRQRARAKREARDVEKKMK